MPPSRVHTVLVLSLALFGERCALAANLTSQERAASMSKFGYDTRPDFVAFDPEYRSKRNFYMAELEELQKELARQTANGRPTPCSTQLFLEARWLVLYSAHWDRMKERLDALREMLARSADPTDARDQVEQDGSFDHCSRAWFLKLDSTIEELEFRTENGKSIQFPLKLLDRINSPEKLQTYLNSLLVSDIRKTGIDNRFELNIAVTAIERLVAGHVQTNYPFDPELKRALFDFEDNVWQDPASGFFGGSFRLPD